MCIRDSLSLADSANNNSFDADPELAVSGTAGGTGINAWSAHPRSDSPALAGAETLADTSFLIQTSYKGAFDGITDWTTWTKVTTDTYLASLTSDFDGDTLTLAQEISSTYNTDPTLADTDGDGASDFTDLDPLDASATGQEETTEETETLAKQIGLASRGLCGTLATDPLIAGFFVSGNTSKSVIVTAKGPSLSAEISDFLPNPSLYVVNGTTGQLVGSLNDDWQNSTDVTNITNSGRAPSSDLDSAIILYDLEPGPYSAICYDSSDATGTALIEVYEYDDGETEDAKFDGLATRGYCGPLASEPRIVGFFVGGDDGESIDVYVGAKGPSLATEGVASPISDPAIYVVNGTTGALVGLSLIHI